MTGRAYIGEMLIQSWLKSIKKWASNLDKQASYLDKQASECTKECLRWNSGALQKVLKTMSA